MPKLKIGIIDLIHKGPTNSLYAKIMHANLASIMPQVVATWCEQEGHEVKFAVYTGLENISKELPKDIDLIFICSFTEAALMAYSLSNLYRSQGVVTVLGGPHARCYPEDSAKYFDYVLGFTDKDLISEVLRECSPHKPLGVQLSGTKQPEGLPGVAERWKFIEPTLKKSPLLKIVPMIGSMGCPYTCSFCIDSTVPYQPLDFDIIKEDLKFLLTKYKRPWVAWHDPNFGIRFNDYMEAMESIAKPGSVWSIVESSLSILSESNLKRFKHNGIIAVLPGIESWYEMGNKSKAMHIQGEEKMKQISEHVNMITQYIPYIQTNFVLGLDGDEGKEPFELTKRFVDLSPGAFPGYSLLTAFGEAAPLNLSYQQDNRVLPFPHSFLNNFLAMNLKPKNYEWIEFYENVVDLAAYTFSWRSIGRRFRADPHPIGKLMNLMRAVSAEGFGRLGYFRKVLKNLKQDKAFRAYFEGETTILPEFYINMIRKDLGPMLEWLPEGAMYHDQNAYLKKQEASQPLKQSIAS
ncbi:MAG: radical SAM protein [Bacteroidetes bacterium]|nr:radical SAM protein [Bacteroidota bacterium]